jgi:hypothetical protein
MIIFELFNRISILLIYIIAINIIGIAINIIGICITIIIII